MERDGDVGLDRGAGHLPRGGVDPGGQVDGDDRHAPRVQLLDGPLGVGPGLPREPRAEQGVDGEVGRAVLLDEGDARLLRSREDDRGVAGNLLLRPEQPDGRLPARAQELGGDDEPQTATRRASG
jgi:hypothetical protein